MSVAITIIMIIGAVFIGIFSLPNLINVIKTKNTAGINLPMYIIFAFACLMFMIYGFGMVADHNLSGGLPTAISNLFCVGIAVFTLVIKFRNRSRAKRENMTELQY
jgi:uncharacterized protein with PQ loop repeat